MKDKKNLKITKSKEEKAFKKNENEFSKKAKQKNKKENNTNQNNANDKMFKTNDDFVFIKQGFFFKIFSHMVYFIAFVVMFPIIQFSYGLRVKGRKNIRKAKNAVYVANHTYLLDTVSFSTHLFWPKHPYYLAGHDGFNLPFIRQLVRLLRAVPVPTANADFSTYKNFYSSVNNMLADGGSILIYPEGDMQPYRSNFRNFESGAFKFAALNNLPIISIVASFRKLHFFYKIFGRKKPLVSLEILPPVYADASLSGRPQVDAFKNQINNLMWETFLKNNKYDYIYPNKKKKTEQNKNNKQ